MIPFHHIYSWFFKSFRINGETELIDRLISEGYAHILIIKRSWIFALFVLWIPIVILILSCISIAIAFYSLSPSGLQYIIIGGNILMSCILVVSSWSYIRHFREIQSSASISTDPVSLRAALHTWDTYFTSFFNWSITNQVILSATIIAEIALIAVYRSRLGDHFWILATDVLIISLEVVFLKLYRKRMMDLEMDYNIVVPGKIYFVNQSGVLSAIQTIESDKIKTVKSSFPSKIASFFDYGTVDILTEWDTQAMMGTMSMYYVTDPDRIVSNIQSLLDVPEWERKSKTQKTTESTQAPIQKHTKLEGHTIDTREQIRDILE